jgi:hypothetical protein
VEQAAGSNSARAGQAAGGRQHRECWASGGFVCRRVERSDGGGWQTSERWFCRLAGGGDRRLPSIVAGYHSSRARGRGIPPRASFFFAPMCMWEQFGGRRRCWLHGAAANSLRALDGILRDRRCWALITRLVFGRLLLVQLQLLH